MSNNRNWLAGSAGNLVSALNQVYDPTGIAYNVNDNSIIGTGIWRAMTPSDFGGGAGGGSTDMTATNAKLDSLIAYEVIDTGYQRPPNKTCSVNFTGSLLAKSSAGELHSVFGYNSGAFSQFLRIYDGTSTGGSVAGVFAVSATNNFSIDFAKGMTMTSGIFVALSTSPIAPVASSGDAIMTVLWK